MPAQFRAIVERERRTAALGRCRIRWCWCSGRSPGSRARRWPRPSSRTPSATCRIATIAGRAASRHSSIWRPARPIIRAGAGRGSRGIRPRLSRSSPRKMFGPAAGPLVAICGGMLKALGTLAGWVLHDRAGEPRGGGSRPAAADVRAYPRRRHAGRGTLIAGLLGTVGDRAHHCADAEPAVRLAERSVDAVLRCSPTSAAARPRCVTGVAASYVLAVIGGGFCIFVIAWSSAPCSSPRRSAWSFSRCSTCR